MFDNSIQNYDMAQEIGEMEGREGAGERKERVREREREREKEREREREREREGGREGGREGESKRAESS